MEKLTKEQVYVSITSDEEAVKLRDLLQKAGETIYTDSRLLFGEENSYFDQVYYSGKVWMYTKTLCDRTEVTLEQLAEILSVKQQFKVGDRVRIKESSQYYKDGDVYNPINVVGTIYGVDLEIDSWIRVEWGVNRKNSYLPEDLELVEAGKETAIETVTVSRANLGRLYPIVCSSWQSYITYLLNDAGSFAVDVQVPLGRLRQAYKEANHTQKAILIEVAPLPKVKSTANISRWINIYGNNEGSLFRTEEEALRSKCSGCIATIELTGEYTTEVEDPLMDLGEIPF